MRRARIWIVGLALVAGATACSGDDSASPPSTNGSNGSAGSTAAGDTSGSTSAATAAPKKDLPECPIGELDKATSAVPITFWHALNAENEKTLQAQTDKYNSTHPKVKVTLVNQTSYSDNYTKYRAASTADRPNLVQLRETELQALIDSKTALPVQSCIDAEQYDLSDYLQRVVNFYKVDDVLYPMPFNVSNPVLYYNKKAFVKAGLDPNKPPTTIEELRTISQKIVDSGAAKYGIAIDTSTDAGGVWFLEQWFANSGEFYADHDNGRTGRAEHVLFNSDFGVELIGFMQQMVKDGLAFNVGRNAQGRDTLLKLADKTEPAAMAIYTSAGLTSVLAILKSGTFPDVELGLGRMPVPKADGGVNIGGNALWIVKDKDPAQIAATWDYIKWMNEPQQQADFSVGSGYVPIRQSSITLPAITTLWSATPEYKVAYDQLTGTPQGAATAGAVMGPAAEIRNVVADALETVYGGADPKTALSEAAQKADGLLADYAKRTGTGG